MDKKSGANDPGDTGTEPKPGTTLNYPAPSGATSDSASSATSTNNNGMPHAHVSNENATFPPGPSSLPTVSSSPLTPHRLEERNMKRGTKRGDKQTKPSLPSKEETTFVAVTKDDDQDDDATMDISRFVVPGAFSVPGSNSLLELDTVAPDLPVVDSSLAHRDPSFVVTAQLVTNQYEYEHDDDLERRMIEQEVESRLEKEMESRLTKREPTLVVAEVMPPSYATVMVVSKDMSDSRRIVSHCLHISGALSIAVCHLLPLKSIGNKSWISSNMCLTTIEQ